METGTGMVEILTVVGLSAASFVSTSLDNFTLLLGFYGDERYARGRVLFGYLASTAGMVLLAHAVAAAVETAPSHLLGYLGVIPLGLGLIGVYRLLRPGPSSERPPRVEARGFLAVLAVMMANSGDTLAVFVSLFADTAEGLEVWVLLTAAGMAAAYALVARRLVERSAAADLLRRYTRVLLPFLLIGIGVHILSNTPTDVMP